jgi:hypothetical protein
MIHLFSVIIHDLDFVGVPVLPDEADPPSDVDPDAVLPLTITRKPLQMVFRRHAQLLQRFGGMENHELP